MRRLFLVAVLALACSGDPEVPQTLNLPIRGLWTSPNEHGQVPKGALVRAENVVLSREGVLEKRRGQALAIASPATKIWPFADRLLLHSGSTLSYTDAAVTAATPYAASITAPVGRRLRAAAQNGNLYLSAAEATKRLDSPTGSPVDAGVPDGLDVQGVTTGSTGFMANNSAVGYRVLWKTTDANGNVLRGAPSGRAVVTNTAGGTRDVSVSTSVPSGLTSAHRFEVYRTALTTETGGDQTTDPGDEMGLVYEGLVPQAAAVTQLVRATNVVTATTPAAHGFSVGQIVRVGPGGGVAGVLAAVGNSIAATSSDGATWTQRTIPAGIYNGVAWNGSVLVAVGSVAATSPDGTTWTARTIPAGNYSAIVWTGTQFVAVGAGAPSRCATSPDGITWTAQTIPAGNYYALAWNGSLLVAVGYTPGGSPSGVCATSPDGVTWTAQTVPSDVGAREIAWNGAIFLAAGASPISATSPDGITWTRRTAPAGFDALAWNGSEFVALGNGGAIYASSPDGATWSTGATANGSRAAIWTGSQFVGVGSVGGQTSPDGVTWTPRTMPAGDFYALANTGAQFAPGERVIASTPSGTTFTYAEVGGDGTLVQAQTATPLTATVVDSIPSTFQGATLYTSPSQEGILASHYQPPLARDLASFRGSLFALGTTTRATLGFWMLAVDAPSGVQANDTITINGLVFTAKASANVANREFAVVTSGTAATNIRDTASSLISVINRAQGSPVYARDASTPNDQPGDIEVTARAWADSITVTVSRASSWAFASGATAAPETNAHRLAWSPANMPDAFQPTAWLDVGEKQSAGLRVFGLRDSLFVIKEDGIWRGTGAGFNYSNAPAMLPFDTTTVVVAPETAVALDNVIFALSNKGIVQISDTGVTIISRPIKDQIDALLVEPMRSTVKSVAHAVAYEGDGKYILWVPTSSSDTIATRALVYDHFASLAQGEPIWTTRTDDASAAAVNPYDGKLYTADATNLYGERKALDYTDFADGTVAVTVNSATGSAVVLADATGVAAGDMLVAGASRGVVLLVATNTLTLDRTWTGGTGAATAYKAIPSVVELAPVIPVPGGWAHFQESTFLFRALAGAYMTEDFATELAPTWATVPFYGTRDYGLSESALAPVNLRTWVPRDQQRGARLKIRFTHGQAMSPMALEGVSIVWTPTSIRLRR